MDVALVTPPSSSKVKIFKPDLSFLEALQSIYIQGDYAQSYCAESLGLEYIAADLRANDYSVSIIDGCLEETTIDDVVSKVLKLSPSVVGFTGPEGIFHENLAIITKLRLQGFRGHITLGGYYATNAPQEILNKTREIDTLCLGEGEGVMQTLVESVLLNKEINTHPNIAYRDDKKVIVGIPKVHKNLDNLPMPVRDQAAMCIDKGFALGISSSRGCPYARCQFCNAPKGWTARSVNSIVNEIQYLIDEFGISWVTFVDEDFIGSGKSGKLRAAKFAQELIDKNIEIEYMIDCRANVVEYDLFSLLKKSGLRRVFVGFESGTQKILDIYDKGITLEISKRALNILQDLKLEIIPGFIFFDPFSTLEDILESLKFYETIDYYDLSRFANRLHIETCMSIYHLLAKQGRLIRNTPDDMYDFVDPKIREVLYALWHYIVGVFPLYNAYSKNRELLSSREIEYLKNNHTECFKTLLECALKGDEQLNRISEDYLRIASNVSKHSH